MDELCVLYSLDIGETIGPVFSSYAEAEEAQAEDFSQLDDLILCKLTPV